MRMLNGFENSVLAISALMIITLACAGGVTPLVTKTERPVLTEGPAATEAPASTQAPVSTEQVVSTPDFMKIDQALKESLAGSIAYNVPRAMKLNETATIELLLNPSLTPSALATQITEGGEVIIASIQITPRMKAVLLPQGDAFFIQPMHDSPEQLISSTETTKWSWDVTAKQGGTQRLTLVIYRLITVDGNNSWRLVESYRSDIDVEVTLAQRILMLDWKWIAGVVITLIGIPALWRYIDSRSKRVKKRSK